jgi:hypothetical protein
MVLVFAAFAAAAATPAPVRTVENTRVSIRILRPHRASAGSWNPQSRANQRELVKQEPDGSRQRLRLTEFE